MFHRDHVKTWLEVLFCSVVLACAVLMAPGTVAA
jgi:hypothetical protein